MIPVFVHIPKCAGNTVFHWAKDKIGYFGHSNVAKIQQFMGEKFAEAFIFTISRNPYDRLLSAYTYLKQQHSVKEWESHWGDKWSSACVGPYNDFRSFVLNFKDEMKKQLLFVHLIPQYRFLLSSDNKIKCDLLIKMEDLPKQWAELQKLLNISEPPVKKHNTSIHLPWREVYDDEMRSIVQTHYALDFQVFGYNPNE